MDGMFSRRLRPRLVALALLGLGSCDLNPQPDLPVASGSHDPALPGANNGGGTSSSAAGSNNGGSFVLEPGMPTGGTDMTTPDDKGDGGASAAEGPGIAGAADGGASTGGAPDGGAAP